MDGTVAGDGVIDLRSGDSLDLLDQFTDTPDLIATDPPYAFGGSGAEHAISATVAIVLRESAARLKKGGWMLVMCASSWRSASYMVESVRGLVEPVRTATWCKPAARTKVAPGAWRWASVQVLLLRKGKAEYPKACDDLDHITEPPVMNGRRAELPARVAAWMIDPFATEGGLMLDPFAGSGALLKAASARGMRAVGFEKNASQANERHQPSAARSTSPAGS